MNFNYTSEIKRSFRTFASQIGLAIFLSTLVVYLVTLNGVWATDHTTAFVEFDYAVWAHHSFILGSIGNFHPQSVDVFLYYGNYYMANAPGAAFISLPFAIIGFILSGQFTLFGKVLLLTEVPVAFANSIAAYLVFKIGKLYFNNRISSFLAFSYAFSTISWPFATFLYQSDFSALFDLVAVYFALRIGRLKTDLKESGQNRSKLDATTMGLLCGVALSCGIMVDYVNAALIPIIGAYLFLKSPGTSILSRERITCLTAFLIESIGLTFFLLAMYNYASFGNPFVSSEQLYLNGSSLLGSFTFPLYTGIFLNLFTPMRGLFFYSPVLILGVFGFWKMAKSIRVGECILLLAVFLGIFLPYSAWYDVTAGLSYGPRFLVASIPFLLIPAGFVLKSGKSFVFAFVLYGAGVIENGLASFIGVLAPPSSNWFASPFVYKVLRDLRAGNLDQWWTAGLGQGWIVVGIVIISFTIIFPIMWTFILKSRSNSIDGNKEKTNGITARE